MAQRHLPALLIIMDGCGLAPADGENAVAAAKTPFLDSLYEKYPHTTLGASGEDVGLPDGQMGNSEVGHLNIGAGRIVFQELSRINNAIKDGSIAKNEVFVKAMDDVKADGKTLHLMGLMSPGGVHSHMNHVEALVKMAAEHGVKTVRVHAFMDGRDVDPQSGAGRSQRGFETVVVLNHVQQLPHGHRLVAAVGGIGYTAVRLVALEREHVGEHDDAVLPEQPRRLGKRVQIVRRIAGDDDQVVIRAVETRQKHVHRRVHRAQRRLCRVGQGEEHLADERDSLRRGIHRRQLAGTVQRIDKLDDLHE